jgi:hypothetical protein
MLPCPDPGFRPACLCAPVAAQPDRDAVAQRLVGPLLGKAPVRFWALLDRVISTSAGFLARDGSLVKVKVPLIWEP